MKLSTISVVAAAGVANAAPKILSRADSVQGFDISNYQSDVDFQGAYDSGARFVIIKASESTSYSDPSFSTHYEGATDAGLMRGGYHYAHPDDSTGAEQALYFIENGGGWSDDGLTLPGMLDIEYDPNPEIDDCYGVSPGDIVTWVQDFVDTYSNSTGRYPMIYTNYDWWSRCAGDSDAFVETCPLVVASYNSEVGTIPGGWPAQTIWQYSDAYEFGGDADLFNGDEDGLASLVSG